MWPGATSPRSELDEVTASSSTEADWTPWLVQTLAGLPLVWSQIWAVIMLMAGVTVLPMSEVGSWMPAMIWS